MNTTMKIAAGAVAGMIAGTMLMGAAFASPRVPSGSPFTGYGMMASVTATSALQNPSVAEMQAFMDSYRTTTGAIDMSRMHRDVVSGKVTPPHMSRGNSTGASGRGYGMMGGTGSSVGIGRGTGMMGGTY
jgi:hypothetical protein